MQQRLREARENRDAGFTLIELLIVIVVLGILATIVVFGVAQFQGDAQKAACKADVKTTQVAVDAYRAQHNNTVPSMNDLTTGATPYLKSIPSADSGVSINGGTGVVTGSACPA